VKNCYACKQVLPFESFYVDKSQSSGYSSACKPCARLRRSAKAQENKVHETARRVRWAQENPEKSAAIRNRYKSSATVEQKEAHRETCRRYKRENPDAVRRYSSKRRAARKRAVMPWSSELTDLVFYEACDLAIRLEVLTGEPWEVDHVIPLRGDLVCGLHVCGITSRS
jgi:hypothetical protein